MVEITRLSNASSFVRALSDELEAEVRIRRLSSKYNFLLGEPGLEVKSTSLLITLAMSLKSAGKLGGELCEVVCIRLRPMYLRVVIGLGLGLAFFGGL